MLYDSFIYVIMILFHFYFGYDIFMGDIRFFESIFILIFYSKHLSSHIYILTHRNPVPNLSFNQLKALWRISEPLPISF